MTYDSLADDDTELKCLNDDDGFTCSGAVEYRMALSASGKSFPRCTLHFELRLKEQERITHDYGPDSDLPPSWFKAGWGGENEYGERWSDDY